MSKVLRFESESRCVRSAPMLSHFLKWSFFIRARHRKASFFVGRVDLLLLLLTMAGGPLLSHTSGVNGKMGRVWSGGRVELFPVQRSSSSSLTWSLASSTTIDDDVEAVALCRRPEALRPQSLTTVCRSFLRCPYRLFARLFPHSRPQSSATAACYDASGKRMGAPSASNKERSFDGGDDGGGGLVGNSGQLRRSAIMLAGRGFRAPRSVSLFFAIDEQ
uniref:Secreted protein n=1 Tax=Plectus sambesii TaxID=2011161 RepID=A0A914UUY9_9BILA